MAETVQRRFGEGQKPAKRSNPASGIVAILNFVTLNHTRAVAFLVLCGVLFFLPGFFTIPPVDRDEARFAQASKQMVESGDFIDIRFQDEVRYKKPVGIYWLQAAAVETASAMGVPRAELRVWIYRIPSFIGAVGAVLLTYWTGLAFVSRRGAVLAALMMCASVLLGVEARLAKTDAMLLLAITAAMGAMARVYLSWQRGEDEYPPWSTLAIFWTALAAGILIKGPLPLMIAGLCVVMLAVLDRSAGWLWRLRPLVGVPWLLLLVLPWFVAILMRSGDAFLEKSLGEDLLSKLFSGQETHGALPGTYFVIFWLTFWPGAALAGLAAPAVWRARREPAAQFLLAWLVPSWIVFELVPTKLPHYVLPLYPAVAILIVGALELRVLANKPWMIRGISWWFTMPAITAIAAIGLAVYFTHQPAFLFWPLAAAATIFGLFAWRLYDESHAEQSLLNSAAASLLLAAGVYGVVVPALSPLFPSVELARALRSVECHQPLAATAGFHEPSLVFMVGTSIVPADASGAADFLSQGSCRFALIESRQERAFAQRADAIGLRYAISARVDGYNYSMGRPISVAVFRSEETQ